LALFEDASFKHRYETNNGALGTNKRCFPIAATTRYPLDASVIF
jgi:hypothetical protein